MKLKNFLLGVVLLVAGQLSAQTVQLIAVSSDDTETKYALSDVKDVVFENGTMTLNSKSGSSLSGIIYILFEEDGEEGIKTMQPKTAVYVFPNPVQTKMTVYGVDKDAKINLYSMEGTLLQTIPAQENSTVIDVASLQKGLYLLQVGKRALKFIKQ